MTMVCLNAGALPISEVVRALIAPWLPCSLCPSFQWWVVPQPQTLRSWRACRNQRAWSWRVSPSHWSRIRSPRLPHSRDGRVIVLQKGGEVRVLQGGISTPDSALQLTVCTQSERGLLGVALDPEFTANGRLFLYYTRPSSSAPGGCVNRVSRFLMNGNTIDPGSEVVLLDNIGSPAGNHNGGDLDVGNDGFLYITGGAFVPNGAWSSAYGSS